MANFSSCSLAGKAEMLRSGPRRFQGPFPKNTENRSFQNSWYDRFKWLDYNEENDGAQCFYCKLLKSSVGKNDEFKLGKVKSWHKLIEKAKKHEVSADHIRCYNDANKIIASSEKCEDTVKEKLVKCSDAEKERNRKGIKIMFSVVRWLATQNISFRGHTEADGNFQSFLQTFREFMPDLDKFMSACPKNATYMTWKIQNDFIQMIDQLVIDEILQPIIREKSLLV